MTDELAEIDPLEVSLDPDPYYVVPEIKEKTNSSFSLKKIVGAAAAGALILAAILFMLFKRKKKTTE